MGCRHIGIQVVLLDLCGKGTGQRGLLWLVSHEPILTPRHEVMHSWADQRKPLIRTRNKVYIPISILAASHHLNPSAAMPLFQRLDVFFLLSLLKFWWLHGPCTVYPNKSILGTRSQRGWPWPGREIIKTCCRARTLAPCNSITDRSWARHGFGHQTGCGETTALKPDPPAPLCLQHRWAWMKAITPSL